MAESCPATNVTTERIRSAAKHLEQDTRRAQAELNANTIFFKIVAEDMERENDSEAIFHHAWGKCGACKKRRCLAMIEGNCGETSIPLVNVLRQNLLEVLECAHRLEYQCKALQNVSQSFEAGTELTDFTKYLDKATRDLLAADPFDPTNDKLRHNFDQAVWNVHHAGEAAPGQEEEEIVMINENGLANTKCPLTGKPVVELENPVRSTECHHIYEQTALMDYIAQHGRRRCKCAVPGCRSFLNKDNFGHDTALNMEIQEFRIREQVTQRADYADLEDY